MTSEIPTTAQGYATLIEDGSAEYNKDVLGYTNPNLHRRVVPDDTISSKLLVQGVNSYKIVETILHDDTFPTVPPTPENSNEIP